MHPARIGAAIPVWLQCISAAELAPAHAAKAGNATNRILFGSCNKVGLPQPLWPVVLSRRPDVWIWGGDNIYADVPGPPLEADRFVPASPARLRRLYAQQLGVPGYQQLLRSPARLVGTWDDHDFGLNDGDRRYPYRRESQAALLDFLGEAPESPRRRQRGVYAARRFDFPGGSVLVLLLDLRFHRDPYGTPDGDFLGREQWLWLERTLSQSTADVHLVMSSLQFLESRQGLGENWGRFPGARARMLEMLARLRVAAPILLSGDVHFAELGMGACRGGRLLEVTSSGMTHSWGTRDPSFNNPVIGVAMSMAMSLAQRVMPWRYQMRDPATGSALYDLGLNFGELEFDWARRGVTVRIFGEDDVPHLQQYFALNQLGVGSAGATGAQDFAPERGRPAAWRVVLGMAVVAGTPLLAIVGLLATFCISVHRVLRSARWSNTCAPPEPHGDSETESGSESSCTT